MTAAGLLLAAPTGAPGQVTGAAAEMDRLEVRAEEAIANGDPEGAAMTAGKAALMAAQLAREADRSSRGALYRAAESLYRGQEHAYRAVALFERAGAPLPAPAGVCGLLTQSGRAINEGRRILNEPPVPGLRADDADRWRRLRSGADAWPSRLQGLQDDWQCPRSPGMP